MTAAAITDRPLAAAGLTSYRYRGRYGWIMVGARDDLHAMREAQRSTDDTVTWDRLQRWDSAAGCYTPARFDYSPWRHGGWYVGNVHYPSGAVGCVSRNYADGKWRIVGDKRPFEEAPTFKTRDDAARAEWLLAKAERGEA